MASIYDKALKRKDFSGLVDGDKKEEAKDAKDAKDAKKNGVTAEGSGSETAADKAKAKEVKDAKEAKANEPKAGADTGKIVNLMSVDANRVRVSPSPPSFPPCSLEEYQLTHDFIS